MTTILTLQDYMRHSDVKKIHRESMKYEKLKILDMLCKKNEFGEDYIQRIIRNTKYTCWLLMNEESKIEAMCMTQQTQNCSSYRCYSLPLLVVSHTTRGKGVGSTCLQLVLDKLKSVSASKRLYMYLYSLNTSLSFYQKFGFEVVPIEDQEKCISLTSLEQNTDIDTSLLLRFII